MVHHCALRLHGFLPNFILPVQQQLQVLFIFPSAQVFRRCTCTSIHSLKLMPITKKVGVGSRVRCKSAYIGADVFIVDLV